MNKQDKQDILSSQQATNYLHEIKQLEITCSQLREENSDLEDTCCELQSQVKGLKCLVDCCKQIVKEQYMNYATRDFENVEQISSKLEHILFYECGERI